MNIRWAKPLIFCALSVVFGNVYGSKAVAELRYRNPHRVLIYSADGGGILSISPLLSANFRYYDLTLDPDTDLEGDVITLTLNLHKTGATADSWNFFDDTGKPGAKSWIFAAQDFAQGPGKSSYGAHRCFYIRHLNVGICARILTSKVTMTKKERREFPYKFEKLVVGLESVSNRFFNEPAYVAR